MATYLSLYRKWRPQSFSEVVGQPSIVRTISNTLDSQRIAHAYLFTGPRGTGKTTVARLFAKGLNCIEGPVSKMCGQCEQCVDISQGIALNVVEIDGASNRGIEEIRELRENVIYPPTNGKYKVYIIDEVHMLTTEAFNAFLKTLEEPPAHVVFICATTDPQKVPATILSRCQRYDFKRFTVIQIAERLQQVLTGEGIYSDNDALALIARHAQGGMRDALGLLEQCLAYSEKLSAEVVAEVLGVAGTEIIEAFADMLYENKTAEILGLISELYTNGKDLRQFVHDVIDYFRALLYESGQTKWKKHDLLHVIELLTNCLREMRYVADVNVPLELAVIQLTELPTEWKQLNEKVKQLEAKLKQIEETGLKSTSAAIDHGNNQDTSTQLKMTDDDQSRLIKIQDNWPSYLDVLRQEKMIQPEAFLREGTPMRLSDNMLTIAFPKERGFHKASIEQDKHKEPAERVLSKFFGITLNIECVTADPKQNMETHSKNAKKRVEKQENQTENTEENLDETVSAALRLFGGKVIDIKNDQEGGN